MRDDPPITIITLFNAVTGEKPTVMRGEIRPKDKYHSIIDELLKKDRLQKMKFEQSIKKLWKKRFYEVHNFQVWQLPLVTHYMEITFFDNVNTIKTLESQHETN